MVGYRSFLYMANASDLQLEDDAVRGRDLHSRLIKFTTDHPDLGGKRGMGPSLAMAMLAGKSDDPSQS